MFPEPSLTHTLLLANQVVLYVHDSQDDSSRGQGSLSVAARYSKSLDSERDATSGTQLSQESEEVEEPTQSFADDAE